MHKIYETQSRTLVKTVFWRVVATIISWGTIYWFTGKLFQSTEIAVIGAAGSTVAYYIYERVWNDVAWGRTEKDQ